MKYGYETANLSDTIEQYIILNNRLVVKYLNGNVTSVDFSKEEEQKILNLMLEQAIKRNELYFMSEEKNKSIIKKILDSDSYNDNAEYYLIGTNVSLILFIVLLITPSLTPEGEIWELVISALMFFYFTCIWGLESNFVSCAKERKKWNEELKKYAIYLDMKEELEEILNNSNYHDLFNGVKCSEQVLNINTLDYFSLKDIMKISNNLTGENSKGLVRKKVR